MRPTRPISRIPLLFALFLNLAFTAQGETASRSNGIAEMQWFSGQWSCDGKFTRSGKSISADLSFESTLDNKWMLFRHEDRPPYSYHALSEWGWDEKGQQYVSIVEDSTGGVRLFYSRGFSGSRLVWDGKALGNSADPAERFEFRKDGANAFTVGYSYEQNGQWQDVDSSSCLRKP